MIIYKCKEAKQLLLLQWHYENYIIINVLTKLFFGN